MDLRTLSWISAAAAAQSGGAPLAPVPHSLAPAARRGPDVPKSEWGPPKWAWLHRTTISYPAAPTPGVARATHRRIWAFVSRLPCAVCRDHAIRYLQRHPPDLASTDALQTWAWRFHNAVNARLGKQLVSFDEYRVLYADDILRAASAAVA
jgi:hypothetical protein